MQNADGASGGGMLPVKVCVLVVSTIRQTLINIHLQRKHDGEEPKFMGCSAERYFAKLFNAGELIAERDQLKLKLTAAENRIAGLEARVKELEGGMGMQEMRAMVKEMHAKMVPPKDD